ncbi:MAG: hypothetical protein Q8R92_17235 [Deltaproteobacteria bacterium]|nr:hypothetical protein [Deltaproteobacteria bacterium]
MADIKEIRRQQLRRLVNEHEGMNNLARRLGLAKGAYISQLLVTPPHREISEKTARKWEKILRLPEGWLDGAGVTPTNGSALNTELLARVLSEVTEALKVAKVNLTPAQLADLVAMQYADALPGGRVDPTRIQRLIGLLKR